MSDQLITTENYTTQTSLTLEVKEDNIVSKRQFAPTLETYQTAPFLFNKLIILKIISKILHIRLLSIFKVRIILGRVFRV
jgi:hypothetical protein